MPGEGLSDEQIGFSVGTVETKGLIGDKDGDTVINPLENANTIIKVYDILTSADGNTTVTYIDDSVSGVANPNPWNYTSSNNTHYYWTKTGTHKFFGWLTHGPGESDVFTGKAFWNDETQTLQVGSGDKGTGFLKLLPATSTFDFLYSDIKSYTMPDRPNTTNKAVDLAMSHLFTALSVEVSNQTGAAISGLSVSFANLLSDRKATVSYAAATTSSPEPSYISSETQDATIPFGTVNALAIDEEKALYTTDEYRLLWPQADLSSATVTVAYTIPDPNDAEADALVITKTVALSNVFQNITEMKAGHKYLLQITIKIDEMRFAITVKPLVNMNSTTDPIADNNNEHFYIES